MKKVILTMTVLTVAAAGVQTARAGDREWAVAGKVLTGLVAASVITHAVAAPPSCTTVYYSAPAPDYGYCPPPAPPVVYAPRVYCAPPVYYAPAPVVVYSPGGYCAPPPVCYAPAPVISFRFGHGDEHRHYRHGRW